MPELETEQTCSYWSLVVLTRILIAYFIVLITFVLPGLNLMIICIGAIYGELIIFVNPVIFYNEAYKIKEGEEDPRKLIKVLSWLHLTIGTILSTYAFGYFVWAVANGIDPH